MPHIHELNDFTTSAFILHPTEPKLLLLKHRKIGKWLQPGGHIELDENPLEALHHELEEETGLKPSEYDIIAQPEQPNPGGGITRLPIPFYFFQHNYNETHKHIDLSYLVRAKTTKITDNPDGADAIEWLTLMAIRELYAAGDLFSESLSVCEWIFKHHI